MVGNEEIRNTSNEEQVEQGEQDWEKSAKYFQSEKDKLAAENQNLQKYAKIGKLIEERPDLQQALAGAVTGNGAQTPTQNSRVELAKDEFDPWEAYNDPNSKSYKFRMQEIGDVVNYRVSNQMEGMQKNMAMGQLKSDLQARGLDENAVKDFVQFAGTPANELGVDNVIKMWRAVKETPAGENNPLDQVRETQNIPQSGGVLQGERPQTKTDIDSMWDGIVKAGSRTNVLK